MYYVIDHSRIETFLTNPFPTLPQIQISTFIKYPSLFKRHCSKYLDNTLCASILSSSAAFAPFQPRIGVHHVSHESQQLHCYATSTHFIRIYQSPDTPIQFPGKKYIHPGLNDLFIPSPPTAFHEWRRRVRQGLTSRMALCISRGMLGSLARDTRRIGGNGISYEAVGRHRRPSGQPDDGLIGAVRQLARARAHMHARCHEAAARPVGVCDSEVMFVASCPLIQGAIRVKVHRIDVHMQRPVFFLRRSRALVSDRHSPVRSTSAFV